MSPYDADYRGELARWEAVAQEADGYAATVYDYTNDLCLRDHLERWITEADPDERDRRRAEVERIDERFIDSTVEDSGGELSRYYRLDRDAGWWWGRIPARGPLADDLRATAAARPPTKGPGRIRRMLGGG